MRALRLAALLVFAAVSLGSAKARWESAELHDPGERGEKQNVGWFVSAPTKRLAERLAVGSDVGQDTLQEAFPELRNSPPDCRFNAYIAVVTRKESRENYGSHAKNITASSESTLHGFQTRKTTSSRGNHQFLIYGIDGAERTIMLLFYIASQETNCPGFSLAGPFEQVASTLSPGKGVQPSRERAARKEKRKGKITPRDEPLGPDSVVLRREGRRPSESPETAWTEEDARQLSKASEYLLLGNLYSAESILGDLARDHGGSSEAQLGNAALMRLLGRPEDFESSLARARGSRPDLDKSPPGFLCKPEQGQEKKGSGRRPIRPMEDPCVSISNGLIREAFGNTKGALESYSAAIGADPRNWLAYAYRGILRIQLKDCVRGVLDLQRSGLLNPQYKSHAEYYIRQCPQTLDAPAGPAEPTPANPFPERAEDQKLPGR